MRPSFAMASSQPQTHVHNLPRTCRYHNTQIVHDHGGQVYMDGANMNAQVRSHPTPRTPEWVALLTPNRHHNPHHGLNCRPNPNANKPTLPLSVCPSPGDGSVRPLGCVCHSAFISVLPSTRRILSPRHIFALSVTLTHRTTTFGHPPCFTTALSPRTQPLTVSYIRACEGGIHGSGSHWSRCVPPQPPQDLQYPAR